MLGGCTLAERGRSDDVAPAMIHISPGTYMAGSAKLETDAFLYPAELATREQPARRVRIAKAYRVAINEVTRGEFARFVAETGWKPAGPCSYLADGPSNKWETDHAHNWMNPGFKQNDDHPVVCVSLMDARNYAEWLSRKTGRRFRLPSNTEWEYAARAGTSGPNWWGDRSLEATCRYANVGDFSRAKAHNRGMFDPAKFVPCDDGHVFTAPVGSFVSNPWGFHDMLGNVWEWTLDCAETYQIGSPADPSIPQTPNCPSYIDRGASWTNSPKYVRAAVQHPELAEARTTVLGFRLVEDLP